MIRPRLTLASAPAPSRTLSQCNYPGCEIPQSATFWPYCSQSCAVRSAWEAVAAIEQAVEQLDAPFQELRRLDTILDGCPFAEDRDKLQHTVKAVRALIGNSQRTLAKCAVDFVHGATAFTDALGPLTTDCDDKLRQAHPEWTKHPETWSVARDPRWQRGAMGGDFVQHWLSYHLFDTADDVNLVVYRSIWLRDTDTMYKPVADILAGGYEILLREVRPDTDMMFGQGELTVYAVRGG